MMLEPRRSRVRGCSLTGCDDQCIPGFAYCILHAQSEEVRHAYKALRGVLEQAVEELDGWRDKGSDVMRDEQVDDFLDAAKAALR